MKNRIVYAVIAALAFTALGAMSQKAVADDNSDFRVLSPLTPVTQRSALLPRTLEMTISSPVVIETYSNGVTRGLTTKPMMLEKTSVAKRHHFLSFGVWP